ADVSAAEQADRGEAQVKPADQDGIEDRDDSDVAVDREVAEHQRQQFPVAEELFHPLLMIAAVGEPLYLSRKDDPAFGLEVDQSRRDDVDDAGRFEHALRHHLSVWVDMSMHVKKRLEVLDQAQEGDEADM